MRERARSRAAFAQNAVGFTLIEILVVLVIIAIIITLAAVKFGPSVSDRAQQEAERLQLLLENVGDEAIATGQTLGWSPNGSDGYRFWRQDQTGAWVLITDNEVLRPRTLPEHIHLADIRVNLSPLPNDARIVFLPSGVNPTYSLEVQTDHFSRKLSSDPIGHIQISEVPMP